MSRLWVVGVLVMVGEMAWGAGPGGLPQDGFASCQDQAPRSAGGVIYPDPTTGAILPSAPSKAELAGWASTTATKPSPARDRAVIFPEPTARAPVTRIEVQARGGKRGDAENRGTPVAHVVATRVSRQRQVGEPLTAVPAAPPVQVVSPPSQPAAPLALPPAEYTGPMAPQPIPAEGLNYGYASGCPYCGNGYLMCNTCTMYQHYPYYPAMHGYYYFIPYNACHVPRHQEFVARWGGDPRNPYANEVFQTVYAEYRKAPHGAPAPLMGPVPAPPPPPGAPAVDR